MSWQDRRLSIISKHFDSQTQRSELFSPNCTSSAGVCSKEFYKFLVRDNVEMREAIFDFLKDPLYSPNYYLSLPEFRALTSARVKKFVDQRFFSVFDYLEDPLKFQAGLECLSFSDYSLAIKSGVHFTLCGGTIAKLGTTKHHREFLPKMDTLELPGCFSMTELGHGSNVMGIETSAVYDPDSQEFIINTPTNEASKFWIGGAAQTAKISTVFAQLTVDGQWQGPHVFVVRLRDDNGNMMPGVRAADNGPKMGLNGVDNGQLWFKNVRVPRDALLDRYASVDEEGTYSSPIPNVAQRFGTMVGGLTTGRLLIAQGAVDACKIGTIIAIRYALSRPQFGETPIMKYLTHQRRLLPAVSITIAMHLSMGRVKNIALKAGGNAEAAKQVHVMSSGLKAAATWHRVKILQDCRECCGGLGFMASNRIGPMATDMNVDTTFEGDNTVMMQQVAKSLLDDALKRRRGGRAMGKETVASLEDIRNLLKWRQECITDEIAQDMREAAASGGAKAATTAFEANLDRVVQLGWAYADALSYEVFLEELNGASPSLKPVLGLLCRLYGLSRVEAGFQEYLAGGVADAGTIALVREQVHTACKELLNGNLILSVLNGFGIPDHLIQAPIATSGWRHLQG